MRSLFALVTIALMFSGGILASPEPIEKQTQMGASNGTSKDSLDRQCAKMAKLEMLSKLASNSTKLDEIVTKKKLTDAQAAHLKSKAANASTELTSMQANATLVSSCAVVDAHKKLKASCREMDRLMTMKQIADNNATALSDFLAKHKIDSKNETAVNHGKEKAANSTVKLDKLMGNSTLMTSCADMKSEQQSKCSYW